MHMIPVEPTGNHATSWATVEAKYADWHGDTIIIGDSRGNALGSSHFESVGFGTDVANICVSGTTLEEMLYMMLHSNIDFSHVKNIMFLDAINNVDHTTDTGPQIGNGFEDLILGYLAQSAETDVRVVAGESYENIGIGNYTEQARHDANGSIHSHATANGWTYLNWAAMDPAGADAQYFRDDGLHLNADGIEHFIWSVFDDWMADQTPQRAMFEPIETFTPGLDGVGLAI